MLYDLIALEKEVQRHLLKTDFTFIGPENEELLSLFIKTVKEFTHVVLVNRSVQDCLRYKPSILKAIAYLLPDQPLKIYVVTTKPEEEDVFVYETVEHYCEKKGIAFA